MSDKNLAQMKTIQLGTGSNTFTTDVYAFSRSEGAQSLLCSLMLSAQIRVQAPFGDCQ